MKIKSKPNKSKSQDKPETSGISDKTIQAREQLFQAVAQQSSDIILLVNREAVVLYENDAVERILGFKADQRIGNKVFDHVHP
ncbi:MAG: PAS domain S-box protein, partial [Smithellaceae bacterium]|nr:PAS domain S-box protein [Smithellaceae bacterium]